MKTTPWVCCVVALLLTIVPLRAADPADDGYQAIFNGKDLTGWRYGKEPLAGKTETPDKRFLVVDGAIVAAEGKGIKDLTTVAEFNKDFDLKLEFRAGPKADSGVYIRGPQLQVRDFIRRNEQPGLKAVFKNDDWNELHISVRSNTIVTVAKAIGKSDKLEVTVENGKAAAKLNGEALASGDVALSAGVGAVCKLNGVAFDPNYKPGTKGGIGLQAETGKFEFRKVRIKQMP